MSDGEAAQGQAAAVDLLALAPAELRRRLAHMQEGAPEDVIALRQLHLDLLDDSFPGAPGAASERGGAAASLQG